MCVCVCECRNFVRRNALVFAASHLLIHRGEERKCQEQEQRKRIKKRAKRNCFLYGDPESRREDGGQTAELLQYQENILLRNRKREGNSPIKSFVK